MKIKYLHSAPEELQWLSSVNTPKSYLTLATVTLIILGICFIYSGMKYQRVTLEPPLIDKRGRLFIGGTLLLGAVTTIATLFFYPKF